MLRNKLLDSKKAQPVALALLSVGLLMVSCGAAWQRAFAPYIHLSAGYGDFLHGFCFGLGFTLEICAIVMLARIAGGRAAE
jgi:hypothetical protein